jgi:hypothetical protein
MSADTKLVTAWHRRPGTIKLLDDEQEKQGKHVPDTIEMQDAIGRDASLRKASVAELTNILDRAQASAALTAVGTSADSSRLSEKFGHKPMHAPQISLAPGHEDDESGHDDGDEPHHPLAPDHGKSSQR